MVRTLASESRYPRIHCYKDEVIAEYRCIIEQLTDTSELDAEDAALQDECEHIGGLIRKLISDNACSPLDQEEYIRHYNELSNQYEDYKSKLEENEALRMERKVRLEQLTEFIDKLECSDVLLTSFDEDLWNFTVESVTVKSKDEIELRFRGGIKLDWPIL